MSDPSDTVSVDEWVELYNTDYNSGISVAPLTGCVLYLDTDNIQDIIFDDGDFVEEYRLVTWTQNYLLNSGDQVRLVCSTYTDSVAYGNEPGSVVSAPGKEGTFGRVPDGSGNFVLTSKTMLSANLPLPSLTPTPNTPTPTTPAPTNTPTTTPTPTNSPSSTPTSTPKPSATPTKKPTPTPKDYTNENAELSADVSQFRYDSADEEKESVQEVLGAKDQTNENISPFAYVLLGLGIVFVGISVFLYIRNKKQ